MGPIHYPKYFKLHSLGRDVNAEVEERKGKENVEFHVAQHIFYLLVPGNLNVDLFVSVLLRLRSRV